MGNVDPFDNYFSSGSGYVEIIRSARFIRFKQLQYCHRDLLIESAGTAAPGIKIHSIPFPGAGVAVAVSIDDEIGVVILRDISFNVRHANLNAEQFKLPDKRDFPRPVPIVISTYSIDCPDILQTVINLRCGNVTGVENSFTSLKNRENLRAEKVVGI